MMIDIVLIDYSKRVRYRQIPEVESENSNCAKLCGQCHTLVVNANQKNVEATYYETSAAIGLELCISPRKVAVFNFNIVLVCEGS